MPTMLCELMRQSSETAADAYTSTLMGKITIFDMRLRIELLHDGFVDLVYDGIGCGQDSAVAEICSRF